MTPPVQVNGQTESLTITARGGGETLPFRYYPASKTHVVNILQGTTYPALRGVDSVKVVVDIGANVGAASVFLALTYPEATVHAIEPAPQALSLLEENTRLIRRIHVHRHGLHEHAGVMRLYRSQWDPMSGSILASGENTDAFDELPFRSVAGWFGEHAVGTIDILKIDTEGCELPLLRALGEQAATARVIYLEYHSEQDRRSIDRLLSESHILAAITSRHPHRGDACYVHRDSELAKASETLAIRSEGN